MKERCINLDWLEVYVLEDTKRYPCNASYFRDHGYFVQERAYGTRVYREMFTICDHHMTPLIEIRRCPYSTKSRTGGLFPVESAHVRLHNSTCYRDDAITFLRDFLAKHDYIFQKIFRVDIALDFERFDRGDDPNRFLQRFIQGRYSKINQANISAHGVDQWNGRFWNSVSWGQQKSMVSTKMYCKTLELLTNPKPYIVQSWWHSHLIDDPVHMTRKADDGSVYKPDIWRVEFSIKSSAQKFYDKATKQELPNHLDMYDNRQKLLTVFASLADHYFHFKKYEDGVRKDRCQDKVLFVFSPRDTFYKIDRLASHTVNNTRLQRLETLLREFVMNHSLNDITKHAQLVISFLEQLQLRNMMNPETLNAELRAFQLLIEERLNGKQDKNIVHQYEELLNEVKSFNGELF